MGANRLSLLVGCQALGDLGATELHPISPAPGFREEQGHRAGRCRVPSQGYSCFKVNVNLGPVTSAAKADSSSALECTPEGVLHPRSVYANPETALGIARSQRHSRREPLVLQIASWSWRGSRSGHAGIGNGQCVVGKGVRCSTTGT